MSMTRTQAEHILDAYVSMKKHHNNESEGIAALREVIVDAMATEYIGRVATQPITVPATNPPYIGKPWTVTCDGTKDVVPV